MKKIAMALALLLAAASCDFLDVVPEGSPTQDDIYKTQAQAEKMLFMVYGKCPDLFHAQAMPDLSGGDDLISSYYGSVRYFSWKSLVYATSQESSTNTYFNMWGTTSGLPTGNYSYNIYEGIRYAYNFLNNIGSVPDISEANLRYWSGEAHFLIAHLHQILLEYYGPIVLAREEIDLNAPASSVNVPRSTYDECVNFIEEEFRKAAVELYTDGREASELIPLACRNATQLRKAVDKKKIVLFTNRSGRPLVTRLSAPETPGRGLSGRHIALWQSHGRYFDQTENRWKWQRSALWQTCEDLYTQSYVLPYLVPMLENAGACVLLPRERDVQKYEVLADNDNAGQYAEEGAWESGGAGFAHLRQVYHTGENPFRDGTTRRARTVTGGAPLRPPPPCAATTTSSVIFSCCRHCCFSAALSSFPCSQALLRACLITP